MTPLPRVGIFVPRFPVPSETFIVTKVIGLIDAGFDIQIFVTSNNGQWDKFEILKNRPDIRRRIHYAPKTWPSHAVIYSGIPQLMRIMVSHPVDFWRLVLDSWQQRKASKLGFLRRIYRLSLFAGHELDILHIEFDTQAIGIIEVKTFLKDCRILLSSRGTFQKTSVLDEYPDAPAYLYGQLTGYHFISEYLRRNAYQLGLSEAVPYWVIKPAIDLSLFVPPEQPRLPKDGSGEKIRLITVARVEWQKGYEFAIDAVARVRAAGIPVEYVIVGTGDHEEAVRFAALQYGLLHDGTVHFTGLIPREEVVRQLQQADIMIHAAIEEGFCNAVIEGQATELPVVVSDAGGLPENAQDGVTGFVVPRRDPAAMAAKIIELACNPELRRTMGQAGRERALEIYDINAQVEAFKQLYVELAEIKP